jgi:invasion protein IalB
LNLRDKRMVSFVSARFLRNAALFSVASLMASSAQAQQAQPRPPAGQPAKPAPAAAAPAQQAGGVAVVPLKVDPNQADWTKVCGRDPESQRETCYTTRDFVAENNAPVLAVAVYESKVNNKAERQVRYLLPLTFLLTPGVRSSVDGAPPVAGRYTICVQNGCFAEFIASDAVFAKFKTGKVLTIQVQNQAARELSFTMPLDGFGKAFDGAPIDPRVLEEQQKKLQEELQRRSDEMRRQIQGGAATPGAVAPAGTPAAPASPAVAAPAAVAPAVPAPAVVAPAPAVPVAPKP